MNEALRLITLSNMLSHLLSVQNESLLYEYLAKLYEDLQRYVGKGLLDDMNESLSTVLQRSLTSTDYIPRNPEIAKLLYQIDATLFHFDALYQENDASFFKVMNLRKKLLLDEIRRFSSKEKTLLDLGCAEGIFLCALKGAFSVRYGLDISLERLERLQKRDAEVQTLCIDLNKEPIQLEEESVDIILATEILEHLFKPAHVFNEMRRVLKKGGRIIGTVPNKDSILYLLTTHLRRGRVNSWKHPQMWNVRSFKNTVQAFGFKLVKLQCFGLEIPRIQLVGKITFLQTTLFKLPWLRNYSTFILFHLLKE